MSLLEWYGDIPIPHDGFIVPRWRAQALLRGKDVQILGGSLARRLAATWFDFMEDVHVSTVEDVTLLGAEGPHLLGRPVGEKGVSWTARYSNASVRNFDVMWAPHPLDICPKLRVEADVVVIALGVHCAINAGALPRANLPDRHMLTRCVDQLRNTTGCLCRTKGSQQIIWRLAPFMWSPSEPSESNSINNLVHSFNQHVVRWRDNHCRQMVLVDGEALLKGRDVGKRRLAGDTVYHLSYPARFAHVQAVLRSILGDSMKKGTERPGGRRRNR